jgi:hypothetical protein
VENLRTERPIRQHAFELLGGDPHEAPLGFAADLLVTIAGEQKQELYLILRFEWKKPGCRGQANVAGYPPFAELIYKR